MAREVWWGWSCWGGSHYLSEWTGWLAHSVGVKDVVFFATTRVVSNGVGYVEGLLPGNWTLMKKGLLKDLYLLP